MNAEQVKADLARLVTELGEKFTWSNGTLTFEYKGIFSPRIDTKEYESGGFDAGNDWTVTCAVDDFKNGWPGVGDLIKKNGVDYRIVEVQLDPYDAGFNFVLTDEDN